MAMCNRVERRIPHSVKHCAWLVATCTAVLTAGCASMSSPREPGRDLARYQAVAGAPVDSMSFWRLDSWEPLDDEHLVVWTSPREAYLLKVWPNCDWMVIVPSIGLTSSVHRVYKNIDKVIVPSRLNERFANRQCPISEIRPIDVPAYKRALVAERAAQPSSGM